MPRGPRLTQQEHMIAEFWPHVFFSPPHPCLGLFLASALTSNFNSAFPFVGVPVHVRDVARAHVDAAVYRNTVAGNSKYILSSDTPEGIQWDRDTRAVAGKYFPEEVEKGVLPREGSLTTVKWRLDTNKTVNTFGWEMTGFEETMKEMLRQYIQLKANDGDAGAV